MYKKGILGFVVFILLQQGLFAQTNWKDPLEAGQHVIQGQAWEDIGFRRLPLTAKEKVREAVWGLSGHSAGLQIRFRTDAANVKVQYIPQGRLEMPHMPATGVSGLDLYAVGDKGEWVWVKGNYTFGDTVKYDFTIRDGVKKDRELILYLPLYNGVSHLQIGIGEGNRFSWTPKEENKPIVVYGTSIAQGACASRPGMAWPAIVGRNIGLPLINLGFSGNGRLEEEVLSYIAEIDAKIYVLDCLPNLGRESEEEVKSKIIKSVQYLKSKRENTAILLVEHAGYSDALIDNERKGTVENLNNWMKSVYRDLLMDGVKEIYLLTKEDIGLSMDATVDGTHPSDLGMQQYAEAYGELLEYIFESP